MQGWWIAAAVSAAASGASQEPGRTVSLGWLLAAALAAAIAVLAVLKDRARVRRDYLASRGGVPWHLIFPLSMLAVLIFLVIGLTGRLDLPTGYPHVPRRF